MRWRISGASYTPWHVRSVQDRGNYNDFTMDMHRNSNCYNCILWQFVSHRTWSRLKKEEGPLPQEQNKFQEETGKH